MLEGKPGLVANGIAFSPDYSKVYFVWGSGIDVADVQGNKIANQRRFTDCNGGRRHCGPDGHRVDVATAMSGPARPSDLGYMRRHGVEPGRQAASAVSACRRPAPMSASAVPSATGCACAASQSVYLVRLGIQGAAIGLRRERKDLSPARIVTVYGTMRWRTA